MISRQLRVILSAFELHLKQIAVDGFVIFTAVIHPIAFALIAIFMLRDSDSFDPIFVIVGGALTGMWSSTLFFSIYNIQGERWSGTLEYIVASPTPLPAVAIGKSIANTVVALSSMVFGYLVALAFFKFELTITNPAAFFVSLLFTVISLISTGLVIAPFLALNMGAIMWTNALEYPIYMLGGFLFPIALLPIWTTPLSYALAPYWAAKALHQTSSGGATINEIFYSWIWALVCSLVYLFVAGWLFRRLVHKARIEASLGMH